MPRTGETIADRYILERAVAEGGMGSVWRARHRTLGRSFAVKFLKTAELGGEPLEQRFVREARLAASIQHRFVVALVDYGVTDEAVPYMVMEFLEGESLDRRARRTPPLSVRELLRVSAEVLLGLEAVHQAGVVHRDLKPANIMLVREADRIIPKLVDFGISRPEVERADGRKRLTYPGAFVGTPWYMSPEQARRDQGDRRSDLYSMGVIIYEALLGEAPFDHAELPALLEKVKAGGAPTIAAGRPELGEDLSAIIERAMALEPTARFESAAQMSARLVEAAAALPESLLCAAPPAVSRTDTEVISRPLAAARAFTRELAESQVAAALRSAGPGRRMNARRERAIAVAGALLGTVLLFWAAGRARHLPPPSSEVQQASTQLSVIPETLTILGAGRGPEAPAAARDERNFASSGLPVAGPPQVQVQGQGQREDETRRPRRSSRQVEGRPRGAAAPAVFRTPGF